MCLLVSSLPIISFPRPAISPAAGVKQDMLCLDMNQAARIRDGAQSRRFPAGAGKCRKVAAGNADVLSRKASSQRSKHYPLDCDAATITIVERDGPGFRIYRRPRPTVTRRSVGHPSGRVADALHARDRSIGGYGYNQSPPKIISDGRTAIFNFVQVECHLELRGF